MLISSQLFDRIVGTAARQSEESDRKTAVLPAGCRRAVERRAAIRIPFGQRTLICRDRGKKAGVWDTVMMQDISLMGIGVLCHDAMEIGDTFVMKVADHDGQFIRIRCAIRRCERGGFGGAGFLLGATFEQVIQHQSLRLNDEDENSPTWESDSRSEPETVVAVGESGGLKKAAFSFFKSLGPSHWLRKDDDYSSV